jgi:hypothetical protein
MASVTKNDQRRRPRVRLSCDVRMRPSLPGQDNFDEILSSENSCRDGFYAATACKHYKRHMRVFVAIPYTTAPGAINRDFVGEILRVDNLPDGRQGIAVQLLDPVTLGVHYGPTTDPGGHRILKRLTDRRTA